MTLPRIGPCADWATAADLCTPCDDYDIDDALMDEYLTAASQILYELSAQQFPGECETTVRPCTRRAYETVWHDVIPRRIMGHLHIGCGCSSNDSCGCGQLNSIDLGYPVNDVTQVKVDGAVLDSDFYRVDDYRYLVRLRDVDDSNPGWPCCQDLTLTDSEEDTFSVTFTYGLSPPILGVRAAAVLACELYMACNPEAFEGKCRLPRNVVQVVRNNIAVQMEPPSELLRRRTGEPMRFGIPEIDLFLQTYNPYGLHAPTVVLSPDLPEMGKRVNT